MIAPDFIPDIDTLKTAVSVNRNFCVENITPKCNLAKYQYILKWIGSPLYDDLKAKFDATSANAAESAVIKLLQQVISNFGMYGYVPQASVQVSDAGIQRAAGENYQSSYKYQENNLREDYLHSAWDWMELLLIELHANDSSFPLWSAEGKECTRNGFINFAYQFNEHVKMSGGRWMFEQLRPLMKSLEIFVAEAKLGTAYYEELKAEILSDTVSLPNQKVIDMLRPAIAYFTESEAILKGWAKLTPDGLVLMERNSVDSSAKRSAVNSVAVIDPLVEKNKEFANRHLDKLRDYLLENLDDYPTYKTFYESNLPEEEDEIKKTNCGCALNCKCNDCLPYYKNNNNNSNWVII